jgi:hypothetical protein
MTHLLCVKHNQDNIFSSRAGLGSLANEFSPSANRAIFHDFGSSERLNQHLEECLQKFGAFPAARKFLESLSSDQRLVCRTHTAFVFTAGALSTQRGESSNSRIKGSGGKKAELKKFNLFKLLRWYLDLVELQEEKSIKIIAQLIQKNCKWSDYVDKIWRA